jgi:arabinofuranan 3-O-arabinosyltransferase
VLRWAGGPARLRGTATVQPGPGLDAALDGVTPVAPAGAVRALASSTFRGLPGLDPTAVLDLDPTSGWVSEREAGVPELVLTWDEPVLVDALRIRPLEVPGAGVDPVREVEVEVEGERHRRELELDGSLTIPTTFTDRLVLRFPDDVVERPLGGRRVGIATVEVPALVGREAATAAGRTPPDRTATLTLTCGDGPIVRVDGEQVPTRATALVADLVDGRPVPWEACEEVELGAGEHRLEAPSDPGAAVRADTALLLPADGLPAVASPRAVRVGRWDDEVRRAEIASGGAAIIATTENANEGWEARLDGRLLTPVRVDGWRQGWLVPAGRAGQLELRYVPDRVHRGGLALGAALILALVLAAALPGRRRTWAPPAPREVGARVAVGLAGLVVLALLAPLPAAVVLLGGWAAWRLGWIERPAVVVAGLALGAGAVALAIPLGGIAGVATSGGTFTGPAQLLAAAALGVAMASVSPAAGSTRSSRGRSDPTDPDTGTTPAGSG